MTQLDPDWPGNWETEMEPRTDAIPDSLSGLDLLHQIEEDPQHETFLQYTPIAGLHFFTSILAVSLGAVLVFLSLLLSIMLYLVGILFYAMTRRLGGRSSTMLSSQGVGTKGLWAGPEAIEWRHVEHFETHASGKKTEDVVFRGNNRVVWHSNSRFARTLNLEIVGQYIEGLSKWTRRPKLGWSTEVTVYSRPGSELQLADSAMGRRVIDEYDPDVGHFATREIPGSMSSDQLLEAIKEDPEHEKLRRFGNAGSVFILAVVFTAVALITLHPFVYIHGSEGVSLVLIVLAIIWMLLCIWIIREVRKHGFYLSPIGIAAVEPFIEKRAIRWEHIEWLDLWREDGRLRVVEFAGNQRVIRVENHAWHRRFDEPDIGRYLPNFLSWATDSHEDWKEGILRYRRTLAQDT